MPVLVDVEAALISPEIFVMTTRNAGKRVETSWEFAKRMVNKCFVLHGPREQRKEGGSTHKNQKTPAESIPSQEETKKTTTKVVEPDPPKTVPEFSQTDHY